MDRCLGRAFFAYSTNYLIDVQAGVIVDVEATGAHRSQELDATRTMIDRVERRFAIKPSRLIAYTLTISGTNPDAASTSNGGICSQSDLGTIPARAQKRLGRTGRSTPTAVRLRS